MSKDIEKIKIKITPTLKKYGVTRSSIFGSVARGEQQSTSDVDILVRLRRPIGLLKFAALKRELESVLKKGVDITTYNAVMPRLKKQIANEQVVIL